VPWERSLKPLDSVQRALVTKRCVIKPEQRYNQIMDVVKSRQFDSDPYLKELNITVDSKEMLQIKARILPPPEVKYRGQGTTEITERVNFGKWTIRNRFYTTRDINKWAMVYFGSKPTEDVIHTLKDFETRLPPVGSSLLICFQMQNACHFTVVTALWYYH
jgi:eukaryotic translation initiation factor 2C